MEYKLTYRQNGQVKTVGIRAEDSEELIKNATGFINANNEPLRTKGFNANPAYIQLIGIEPVGVTIEDNVPAGAACPKCGEARIDYLVNTDGEIHCISCDNNYDLEPERRLPSKEAYSNSTIIDPRD